MDIDWNDPFMKRFRDLMDSDIRAFIDKELKKLPNGSPTLQFGRFPCCPNANRKSNYCRAHLDAELAAIGFVVNDDGTVKLLNPHEPVPAAMVEWMKTLRLKLDEV